MDFFHGFNHDVQMMKKSIDELSIMTEFERLTTQMNYNTYFACDHCDGLLNHCEGIKNKLVNELLLKWKKRQQELSVGCNSEEDQYNLQLKTALDELDLIFEKLGRILQTFEATMMSFFHSSPGNLPIDRINRCRYLLNQLIWHALIIYKQPPELVILPDNRIKSNNKSAPDGEFRNPNSIQSIESEKANGKKTVARKYQFMFDTEFKLLGSNFLDCSILQYITFEVVTLTQGEKPEDQTYAIEAKNTDDTVPGRIRFVDMSIRETKRRPKGVDDRRYAICYSLQWVTNDGLERTIKKFSLPFAIVAKSKIELEYNIFLERSFANLAEKIFEAENYLIEFNLDQYEMIFESFYKNLNLKCQEAGFERILEALEFKFRSIVDTIMKSHSKQGAIQDDKMETDEIFNNEKLPENIKPFQQRFFSDQDKKHLRSMVLNPTPKSIEQQINMLCRCTNCQPKQITSQDKLRLGVLLNHIVAMKPSIKKNNLSQTYSPCAFIEWFWKAAEIAGTLGKYWNMRLKDDDNSYYIYGFCDQEKANEILSNKCAGPRMLVRFANTRYSWLRFSIKYLNNEIEHGEVIYDSKANSDDKDIFTNEQQLVKLIKELMFLADDLRLYPNYEITKDPESTDRNGYEARNKKLREIMRRLMQIRLIQQRHNEEVEKISNDFNVSNLPANERFFQEIGSIELGNESGVLELNGQKYYDVKIEHLKCLSHLGEGAFGYVTKRNLELRTNTGETFNYLMAVKEMKLTDKEERKLVFRDLYVVMKANSPDIVKFYGYIKTSNSLYICMEMMDMCLDTLLKILNTGIPEEIIGKIVVNVVRALKYLKDKHDLMHRDIKPSNILIEFNGNIKLCDFGFAGLLNNSLAVSTTSGCANYLAPERIKAGNYGASADVWALGLTIVHLAHGKYPYNGMNVIHILHQIQNDPPPSINGEFTKEFCHFVKRCLEKDPNERARYSELINHLFYLQSETKQVDITLFMKRLQERGIVR